LLISGKIEEKLQLDWNRIHVLQAKREKVLACATYAHLGACSDVSAGLGA
jgi:hypothetical protein